MNTTHESRLARWPVVLVPDAALALLVALLLLAVQRMYETHAPGAHPNGPVAYVLLATTGLVLTGRRLFPRSTYAATVLLTLTYLLLHFSAGAIWLAPFVAALTVVTVLPLTTWIIAVLAGDTLLAAGNLVTGGSLLSTGIWASVWLVGIALFATVFLIRQSFLKAARARAELARQTKEEEALRRMAEERLRIAREIHDVVGHSLAVISLQAGVAEHLLESKPDEVRRAISAIRKVSKDSLGDLRREIALLRGHGAAGDQAVLPGLAELPTLIESMREAGMQVELAIDVDHSRIPDIVETTIYRIAQESLTNVARHGGKGAQARIRVSRRREDLEVEVIDDGPGSTGTRGGTGINGMRERAMALGGEFAAGNRPQGGYRVWASIPLGPE